MNCENNQTKEIGVVSPVPRDAWLSTIMYYKLNIVRHNNAVYIAKDKNVGIEPGSTEGWQNHWMLLINLQDIILENVPTKTSELENNGDGESPFATESYVKENGGKIDSISVNNEPQEIDENKNVNILIPETKVDNLTIDRNTLNELRVIGLTDGSRTITFEILLNAITIERS